ncbi:EAL and modified HD-GYP domain-containing signal transduction protein [Pseudoduganella lurida]|uniref:EAL and modified HD-GYP domain-containing signal transduction protein n=1 Tax=Pseudoduganella lurida TaxID=1036180 RepID=A0A562RCL2_9BURK|nr:HDOD domain-containing protein [Pseudoduganella lurida]TWI66643.1 EAL and modified HD-GYP domain-containing signal transduction protein [Pseudoduganella lurida]
MHQTHFLVREPLLDPQQRVVGYELCWQHPADTPPAQAGLEGLVSFVADQVCDAERGWLLRDKTLFLQAVPAMLSTDALHCLPPQHTVLSIRTSELANPDTLAAVRALRAGDVGILLRNCDLTRVGNRLPSIASYVEVRFSGANVADQARTYAALKQSSVRMVGRPVTTWEDYDICAALGIDAFVGKLHLTPRPGSESKGLNPAQAAILQLMQMVRENADVPKLESVLKRDAALSYKLLRYINSAGFGAGREIQSLKQAITLLGYQPLYRWLTLLLATASTSGYSPVLLETAVVRGRLAELLGTSLGRAEAENIFVAGMFSLLDRLLGIPMGEVLETMPLSADIAAALLNRGGKYGPYLALAEACELNSDLVAALAASLQLSPEEVNKAHLSALAWTQAVTA